MYIFHFSFLIFLFFVNCSLFNKQIPMQNRVLVAVLPVENKTGKPENSVHLKNLQNEIIVQLHKTQKFRLIERERIDLVLKEISLSQKGVITAKEMEIGKILGVDAVLITTLERLDALEKNHQLGPYVNLKNVKVITELNGRLIQVKTGEILSVGNGKSEEEKDEQRIVAEGKTIVKSESISNSDMQKNTFSRACEELIKSISENYKP